LGHPDGRTTLGVVITVERNVELAGRRANALDLLDDRGQAFGQWRAASENSNQRQVLGPVILLENLMRDARQGPAHVVSVHNLPQVHLIFAARHKNETPSIRSRRREGVYARIWRRLHIVPASSPFPGLSGYI